MVLLALPPADHLLIERDRGQFVPSRRHRMMANVRAERSLKIPAEPSPELRIPGAAAQTRVVSMVGIRLGSWESVRAFKGIICDDISELSPLTPARRSVSVCSCARSRGHHGRDHCARLLSLALLQVSDGELVDRSRSCVPRIGRLA